MKVVTPSRLMSDAADVLAPVRDAVVVFGAIAVEVALAEADTAITPTRDVDLVVATPHVAEVVRHLEDADLRRSEVPHERGFTWVRGDLKVQLVRSFHPFPSGPAELLPSQPSVTVAADAAHQDEVSFADDPARLRFRCVSTACLVALKGQAFGRLRPGADTIVDRDFCDVYLVLREAGDAVVEDYLRADRTVRTWVEQAVEVLAGDEEAITRAAREASRIGVARDLPSAQADVRRVAARFQRRLTPA